MGDYRVGDGPVNGEWTHGNDGMRKITTVYKRTGWVVKCFTSNVFAHLKPQLF